MFDLWWINCGQFRKLLRQPVSELVKLIFKWHSRSRLYSQLVVGKRSFFVMLLRLGLRLIVVLKNRLNQLSKQKYYIILINFIVFKYINLHAFFFLVFLTYLLLSPFIFSIIFMPMSIWYVPTRRVLELWPSWNQLKWVKAVSYST